MHTPRQTWRHVTPKAQLLIALALVTVLAFSAGLASGIYGRTMYTFLTVNRSVTAPAPVAAANQAAPLGIDLPAGAQRSDLPAGLTDYLRPGSAEQRNQAPSAVLGILLPHGATARDLPRGLTDYLRPQNAEPLVAASSAVLGITMPTGAHYNDLPRGVTDYLRPNQQ
jgi:hypothetical protein